MDQKPVKAFILVVMVFSFAAAAGTLINGVFAFIGSGGKDPASGRMLVIALCFFLAAIILRKVLQRSV